MRRIAGLFVVSLAGCSTAPVAGTLDWLRPSRLGDDRDRPPPVYGPLPSRSAPVDRKPEYLPPPGLSDPVPTDPLSIPDPRF